MCFHVLLLSLYMDIHAFLEKNLAAVISHYLFYGFERNLLFLYLLTPKAIFCVLYRLGIPTVVMKILSAKIVLLIMAV